MREAYIRHVKPQTKLVKPWRRFSTWNKPRNAIYDYMIFICLNFCFVFVRNVAKNAFGDEEYGKNWRLWIFFGSSETNGENRFPFAFTRWICQQVARRWFNIGSLVKDACQDWRQNLASHETLSNVRWPNFRVGIIDKSRIPTFWPIYHPRSLESTFGG